MPRTFQRPTNLPNEIQIHHITPRDADADLILKVTALATNESAVIPTYKEEMVDILPTYFGMVFDKNKDYQFRESRLQPGEYFEIGIPNLKSTKNLAKFLAEILHQKFICGKISFETKHSYDWPEFFWIANYFNENSMLYEIIGKLPEKFCQSLNCYEFPREIKEKIKKQTLSNFRTMNFYREMAAKQGPKYRRSKYFRCLDYETRQAIYSSATESESESDEISEVSSVRL